MSGYRVDTFQRTSLILFRQAVESFGRAHWLRANPFFIFCAQCLRVTVRHFLGYIAKPEGRSALRVSGLSGVSEIGASPRY